MHYVDDKYQFLLEKHLPEIVCLNTLLMNKSALICLHLIFLQFLCFLQLTHLQCQPKLFKCTLSCLFDSVN